MSSLFRRDQQSELLSVGICGCYFFCKTLCQIMPADNAPSTTSITDAQKITTTTPPSTKSAAYWTSRQHALNLLRREVLFPYFTLVEELRITTQRAVDADEIVRHSFTATSRTS